MKLSDHLRKKQREQLEKMTLNLPKRNKTIEKPEPINEKIDKESLSYRDIEELMGTRRDTFKRVRGAVRRR